jgi:hypothetical protein
MTDVNPPDGGLPPPPPPKADPAPDLAPHMVRDGLSDVIRDSAPTLGLYADGVAAANPFRIDKPKFDPAQINPLTPTQSQLDAVIGPVDTSGTSMATTIGTTMAYTAANPIKVVTDSYQTSKINQMQQQFLHDHQATLSKLNSDMSEGLVQIRNLVNLLQNVPRNLEAINNQLYAKRTLGNAEYKQVQAALADPGITDAVRADLEAQKADLQAFMDERDDRVALDEAQLGPLREVVDTMSQLARAQADLLQNVQFDAHPTVTVGTTTADPTSHIIETTHSHPDALVYVAQLRTMLFNLRAGMDLAMVPPPETAAGPIK